MFNYFKQTTPFDEEIERLTRELKNHTIGSDEYSTSLDTITKLQKVRNEERSSQISKDTWITAGTNLLGILLIISYEHSHVMTSKALPFVKRVD